MTTDSVTPTASVLVVEDSTAIRRLFEVVLRDVADPLFIVANQDEANQLLATESIDVVVMEPQGPNEVRWGLLNDLKAAAIPAIIVTSRVDEQVQAEATRRGAFAFLSKPFMPAELQAVICSITGASDR
jgi:two-component system KDP operon response regulator KdpE